MHIISVTSAPAARAPWTVEQGRAHALQTARVAVQRAYVATSSAGEYDPRELFWNLRASANVAQARAAVAIAAELAPDDAAREALEALGGTLRGVVQELLPAVQRHASDPLPPHATFAAINTQLAATEDVLDLQRAVGSARSRALTPSPLHPTAHRIMADRAAASVDIARRGAELVSADAPSLRDAWAAWMRVNHLAGINETLAGLQVPGASAFSPGLVQALLTPTIDAVEQLVRAARSNEPPAAAALQAAQDGFVRVADAWQRTADQLAARSPDPASSSKFV